MLSHLASKRRATMTLAFVGFCLFVCLSTKLFVVVFLWNDKGDWGGSCVLCQTKARRSCEPRTCSQIREKPYFRQQRLKLSSCPLSTIKSLVRKLLGELSEEGGPRGAELPATTYRERIKRLWSFGWRLYESNGFHQYREFPHLLGWENCSKVEDQGYKVAMKLSA